MEPHDEIAEHDTGLFSEAYLHSFLPTRVAAARRGLRPLGLKRQRIALAQPRSLGHPEQS